MKKIIMLVLMLIGVLGFAEKNNRIRTGKEDFHFYYGEIRDIDMVEEIYPISDEVVCFKFLTKVTGTGTPAHVTLYLKKGEIFFEDRLITGFGYNYIEYEIKK